MAFNRWLTDEEYQQAESNGISRRVLYMRMYRYGWELQEALTTPPRTYWHMNEGKSNKWLELATENGINSSTFYSRVNNGWDPKDAASIPTRKQMDRKELVKIAESNGISVSTFRSRLSYGWEPIKAATTPAKAKKKNII
ncbi:hypothetical protein F8161_24155 [Bacillus cereus]|uniref:Nucleoside permease n=1 Tax=Bacillus thuringiensis TaxID=1428 RepID=A0A9X7B258_BACTU|nr:MULTISPECIES: hypothetical protein [Bacillus cereus group]EJR08744.1 hypothetical protein II5_01026 [Bacillus cereus MSX-A1]KAB2456608.1 hypothetical protein F8161_24155 [Bacillus cereus]MDF9523196.1 hypothetical protein [Bacillus cereus]MDF9561892.1 hypothetical protein [Bacillus cereus]MDR4289707.1 hypothetical protein [Bacillus cereus]